MRLFIGIFLPEDLALKVWESGKYIKGNWKREPPNKLHITLKFIGEFPDEKIHKLTDVLRSIRFKPFDITLKGVGFFPSNTKPRVIWVGVEGLNLIHLAETIDDVLFTSFGIQKEWREFTPHVTLGRVKGFVDISTFVEKYKEHTFGSFSMERFYLVQSVLKPSGSEYKIIQSFGVKQ